MIDEKLLEILACPACDERPPVELKADRLVCTVCRRAYPIRDGIPVMLVDEATLEAEEQTCASASSTDRT